MAPKKSAHFRRPYQKPQIGSSKPTSRSLQFAITFDMLSDEEIEDVRDGIALIKDHMLVYPNTSKGNSLRHLYKDRRLKLLEDRLLGLDEEPKT